MAQLVRTYYVLVLKRRACECVRIDACQSLPSVPFTDHSHLVRWGLRIQQTCASRITPNLAPSADELVALWMESSTST